MAEQKSCKQSFGENIEQGLSAIKVLFLTLKTSYFPPNQIMPHINGEKKIHFLEIDQLPVPPTKKEIMVRPQ